MPERLPPSRRPYLRLVGPDASPSPTQPLFVENSPVPTVNLSTSNDLTFTFRGHTVPTVEALCAELHARRAAGESLNGTHDPGTTHYGRPYILVTGEAQLAGSVRDEEVMFRHPWDHTVWSLLEAAETARSYRGAVFVEQSILLASDDMDDDTPEEDGCIPLDTGFTVMVADFLDPQLRAEIDAAEASARVSRG